MSSSILWLQCPISLQQAALFPLSKLALTESKKTGRPADGDSSSGTRFTHAPQNTLLHLFVLEMSSNAVNVQLFHFMLLSINAILEKVGWLPVNTDIAHIVHLQAAII